MASTPSASALSAVLRCRGNIWTRNPPTKRPATSVYSLGLAGGVVRDSPAERTRSNQASAREAFLQGERVVVGGRLAVAYKSPGVEGKVLRDQESADMNPLCHPKLSQSPGGAHSAAPGVQNALVRQLAHTLTSHLPGTDGCSQIIEMIKSKTFAPRVCKHVFVQGIGEFPAGLLKVSITSPRWTDSAGRFPSFASTGWSTLKSTCSSLTALVFLKLGVLCRSAGSPDAAPQHLLSQQEDALQANGQTHSPADLTSGSGQKITEDRPD